MAYGSDDALKTIEKNGKVPETRMESAADCQDFVRRLAQDDEKRDKVRGMVAGLVDGNPPYSHRKLREAGRADACNVNWGTARSYLESGSGAFYDLSSQAPGFVQIETSHGNEEQRAEWSRTMSKHGDRMFAEDDDWDADTQLSQNEMTLYQCGPLYFENEHQVFPVAVECGSLLVPDRTPSKLSRWEVAVLLYDYYPPELYDFIRNEEAAKKVGWDVEFTKLVIANAMDTKQAEVTAQRQWSFYQTELKSKSLSYYTNSKICKLAHVFWKEFDGRVTHAILERETTTNTSGPDDNSYRSEIEKRGVKYLFIKKGRYRSFKEAIHPMYFDRGRGGFHHNVTGLGVKMFSGMEYENRLLSNLMDKAFSPKVLLKPGNAESKEKLQVTKYGEYGIVPPGTEAMQTPIQGFLTDGLAMFRTSSELMRSNLSNYRQPVEQEKPGNPETAFKEKLKASQQGELSTTTFNRYYRQLDALYSEIIRRACNLNSTDQRAIDFQKACQEDGVPRECFGRIRSVRAVRVVGRGSPFLRAQTTSELADVIQRCPEDGQNHWLNDFIASRAGQDAVHRYNPKPLSRQLASDQQERAQNQIVGMHMGAKPVITSSQNPLTFAGAFLSACVQAIQSVQKGGNLPEIVAFLSLAGPATQAHIKRMEGDPLRADVVTELQAQLDRAEQMAKKLKSMAQAQATKAKAQQDKTRGAMSDLQIKAMKVKGDLALKSEKQRHGMALKNVSTRQQLALNDARSANEIRNSRLKAFHE